MKRIFVSSQSMAEQAVKVQTTRRKTIDVIRQLLGVGHIHPEALTFRLEDDEGRVHGTAHVSSGEPRRSVHELIEQALDDLGVFRRTEIVPTSAEEGGYTNVPPMAFLYARAGSRLAAEQVADDPVWGEKLRRTG